MQIRVSGITKDRFDGVLETLTKAYGEPKRETASAQDAEGNRLSAPPRVGMTALSSISSNTPKPSQVSLSLLRRGVLEDGLAAPKVDGG